MDNLEAGKRLDDVGDGEEGDQLGGVGRVDRDPAQEADEEDDPRWQRLGVQPGALAKEFYEKENKKTRTCPIHDPQIISMDGPGRKELGLTICSMPQK